MANESLFRRLKGAAKNAVVWGAAWFGLSVVAVAVLNLAGVVTSGPLWPLDAVFIGARVGIMGAMAGGFVAALISLFYRGRRVLEISWVRFGLGGGIAAGLFVLAFMATANLLTGGAMPALEYIDEDIILSVLFGGITAGGSMWLAQRGAAASIEGPDRRERLAAGSGPLRASNLGHRAHAQPRMED